MRPDQVADVGEPKEGYSVPPVQLIIPEFKGTQSQVDDCFTESKMQSLVESSSAGFRISKSLPIYYQYLLLQSLDFDELPANPLEWTRNHVHLWLESICQEHGIFPPISAHKFPFNGKGLCFLTLEMIAKRSPLYAQMLYRDLRTRIARSLKNTAELHSR